MTVTWDGALYCGPAFDAARNYSAALPPTPAGDFSITLIVEMRALYAGDDPTVAFAYGAGLGIAQNFASGGFGSSGNDCYITVMPSNSGVSASRGHLRTRLSSAGTNILTSGAYLEGTTTFTNGDVAVIVLQSNGGTIQLKTCKLGSSTVVTEATGARNAAFTTMALGTWLFGTAYFGGYLQTALYASQALADTDIANLAAGTDPETIVTSGNRTAGWKFDATTATIPALWGVTSLTQNGIWSTQPIAAPRIPNAATRIAVTNEPVPYGVVSCNDDGTPGTWTITGTYTGYTPTALQARIEDQTGGDVKTWTDLASFTASAGTWSGTLSVPIGGLYRIQVRDKTTMSIIWRGGSPFSSAPTIASMGQSPMVFFEQSYKNAGLATLTPTNCYVVYSGVNQVVKASSTNIGPGLITALNQWTTASGGVPLVCVLTAVSGTSSTQWATRDAAVWPQFLVALDFLKPKRVLLSWLNGAADAGFTATTIKTNHSTILGNLDADLGNMRGIGYRYRMLPHNRDTSNATTDMKVRATQYEWAAANSGKVLIGPWWPDMQTNTEITGTAQSGTTNTITLAAAELSTGMTAGMAITLTNGTGAGQASTISAYNQTTKVLTITGTWTTIPDTTTTYRIVGTSPHPGMNATKTFGPRLGQDTAYCFGYSHISGQGPTPVSATYPVSGAGADGSILTVTFAQRHGGALRTPNGSTVAGFQVSEDNWATTKTIASAIVNGPNTVQVTLAATPADKTKLLVRYGAPDPVPAASFDVAGAGLGDLLYDDTRVLPTGGLPAYMTLSTDLPVTQATATPATTNSPRSIKTLVLINGVGLRKLANG